MLLTLATSGCLFNDRCELLCTDVGFAIEACMTDSLTWEDLGARSRSEWASTCRRDWERTTSDMSSRDLELALGVCRVTIDELETWDCDEILALYAP